MQPATTDDMRDDVATASRDARITEHMPLVERIARQVAPKFPRQIPIEDMVQSGCVGLVVAADRFDASRQQDFARYAWFVVRGAIIDAHKRKAYREEQHDSLEGLQERMGFMPAALTRDTGPLPDELAEREEKVRTVALLIAELPEAEGKLMRAVMAGASVPEAARALGRSPAWGRARLAEARDRIGAGVLLR
jgi:RNA polymerase sigma factor (sigma-70 family)